MLTNLTIRNLKRFGEVSIELGNPVVFVGPNDSGKTTALQALALWEIGLKRWNEKQKGRETPAKRPGVTINRRDLLALPVPRAKFLWRNLTVRHGQAVGKEQQTPNIYIDVIVKGVRGDRAWQCGLEFYYANEESFYCRPLRQAGDARMPIPVEASSVHIAFLPPMSGLAANETRLDPGAINVRLGEGRTAEVLRNLCYLLVQRDGKAWGALSERIKSLFGVQLDKPEYVPERGEITMTYRTASDVRLDLSSSGRGMQQTLLLLAHMAVNPDSVLLLDEPDAHLEILRQRQIYRVLTDTARQNGSQIIVASHSEVILNEAATRDVVVSFLGKPHRIDDRGHQLLKSLKNIGFEQYLQAQRTGWVLYLEGSTDLAILQTFAKVLGHAAQEHLERPSVHYVENRPPKAQEHFYGLKDAKRDLVGCAIFDRLPREPDTKPGLKQVMWGRREIENYLCQRSTLLRWSERQSQGPLFSQGWRKAMETTIDEVEQAMETLGKGSPWSSDTKVSDDFLAPLFEKFYQRLELPNLMHKSNYHQLAEHVAREDLDRQVTEILELICAVAEKAKPVQDQDEL